MLEYGRRKDARLKVSSNRLYRLMETVGITIFVGILFFSSSHACAKVAINLQFIKTIESSGNPCAFNSRTKCYGLHQISEICLQDFNQINKTNYQPRDLFNPQINTMVASWYFKRLNQLLSFYEIPASVTTLLASYNWGIGNVLEWHKKGGGFERLPGETRDYIKKYQGLVQRSLKEEQQMLSCFYSSVEQSHFPAACSPICSPRLNSRLVYIVIQPKLILIRYP